MEREKHEPTFSAPDLQEVRFRSERQRAPRHTEPASPWLYIVVGAALLIAIAMGLIEWNARRQAAAMTRELTRPMTAQEQADFNAEMDRQARQLQAETAAEVAAVQRTVKLDRLLPVQERRPLQAGERCIEGRRFQKIQGGWRDLPNDPC
ncbi:hypothetical protein [Stenotrophomonas indicatrix]|uniref:hypothetical protein n=1 Tax=Stenotrophomonas indicatrix TaxID=2045451 RepID=UPI0034219419